MSSTKKWYPNSDRSAAGRSAAKKTATFSTDTAIRIAITGTANPNNTVVGGVSSILKLGSNVTNNIAYNATRVSRSGGTTVPPKRSQNYVIVAEIAAAAAAAAIEVEPVVPVYTYTKVWYGRASTGSSTEWTYLPTSSDGTTMAFGVFENASVYVISNFGTENSVQSVYYTGLDTMASFYTNSDLTLMIASNSSNIAVSTDMGENWNIIDVGGSLIFSSLSSGILVAADSTKTDVYYSTTYGASWFVGDATGKTGWSSIAGADSGAIVFLANATSAITDPDAGGVWRRTSTAGMFSRLSVGTLTSCAAIWCSSSGEEVLASSSGGLVYYSADTGANWKLVCVAGQFSGNVQQIRAGTSPVKVVYVITSVQMYTLSLTDTVATVFTLTTPTLSLENTTVTISDIAVGDATSDFAQYTISRDNGITQSEYFTDTTYVDPDTAYGNTYIYSITYYTATVSTTTVIPATSTEPESTVVTTSTTATTSLALGSVELNLAELTFIDIFGDINSLIIHFTPSLTATGDDVYTMTATPTSGSGLVISALAVFDTENYATIYNLTPGTEYDVVLSATNSLGTVVLNVVATTAPLAPTNITGLSSTSTSLTFSFTETAGATSYTAFAVPPGDSADLITLENITESPATIYGLQPSTPYTLYMRAINDIGSSDSDIFSDGILTTLDITPVDVSVDSTYTTTTSVRLTFVSGFGIDDAYTTTAVADLSTELSFTATITATDGTITTQTGIASSPATIIGLTSGSTYSITIASVNAGGTSIASTPVSITTISPPPTGLTVSTATATSPTTTSVYVEYTKATGAVSYTLYVNNATTNVRVKTIENIYIISNPVEVSGLTSGTSYSITMVSVNSGGTSALSSALSAITVSPPPTSLEAPSSTTTTDSMYVNFVAAAGATKYTLTAAPVGGGTSKVIENIYTSPTQLSNLVSGKSYSITIQTINAAGTSVSSSALIATTVSPPPTGLAVSTVSGSLPTTTTMSVIYTAATGATSYTMYIKNKSTNVSLTSITGITSSPVALSNLESGVSYTITMASVNTGGTSISSSELTAITVSPPPTNLAAVSATTSLVISYTAAVGADTYKIFYKPATSVSFLSTTSDSISKTILGLTAGTTYDVKIQSVNSNDGNITTQMSAMSSILSATTLSIAPADTSVSVASVSTTSMSINFGIVSGATSYEVYATPAGGTATTTIASISPYTPATIENLSPGIVYSIRIAARNAGGLSALTTAITQKTVPSPPTLSLASGITTTTMSIYFNTATGADKYTLYATPDSGTAPDPITGITTSPVALSNLVSGTTYTITMVALGTVGTATTSAISSSLSATTISTNTGALTISSITTSSFITTFSKVSGATSYTITATTTPVSSATTKIVVVYPAVGSTDTTFSGTLTGLTAGTTYSVSMFTTNAGGDSGSTTAQSVVTVPVAPLISSTGTAATSSSTISISFGDVVGETSYIAYATDPTGLQTQQTTTALQDATTATISGLASGTTYNIKMNAVNSTAASDDSNTLSILTFPAIPVIASATATSTTEMTVLYSKITSATEYRVYAFLANATVASASVISTSDTTAYLTGLTAGTVYTIKMYAKNGSGLSDSSIGKDTITITAAPAISAATATSASTATITFGTIIGASSYIVYATATGQTTQQATAAAGETTAYLSNLASGITYAITMYAINSSSQLSAVSTAASVLTIPGIATITSATATSSATADIVFSTNITGAVSYKIVAYISSVDSPTTTISAATTSPATISGLAAGTTYSIVIYAWNASGYSTVSAATPVLTFPAAPVLNTTNTISSTSTTMTIAFNTIDGLTYTLTPVSGGGVSELTGITTGSISLSSLNEGTAYTFNLYAVNASGSSTATSVSLSTRPAAPTVSSTASATSTTMSIAFGVVSGLTYTLTPVSGGGVSELTGITASPISLSSLNQGTAYTFYLYALNSSGSSAPTPVSLSTRPAAPSITSITSATSTTMTILYTVVSGLTYTLTSAAGGTLTYTIVSGTISVSALTENTSYTFYLKATNASGDSLSTSTTLSTLPAAPTITSITSATSTTMTILYTVVSGLTYTLTSAAGGTLTYTNVLGTLSISALSEGTSYTFYLKATNASGDSLPTSSTLSTRPAAPTSVNASSITSTSMSVNMVGTVTGATGYSLTVSPAINSVSVFTSSTSPIYLTNMMQATSYSFVAVSTNTSGNSAQVSTSATTILDAPTNLAATSVSATSVSVSFIEPSHSTATTITYTATVYLSSGSVASGITALSNTTTPISISGLSAGTQYTIKVKATQNTVISDLSDSVSYLTVPAVPTAITSGNISSPTYSTMTVAYPTVSSATKYYLIVDPATSLGTTFESTVSPVYVSGMTAATSYGLTMIAYNASGNSAASASTFGATILDPPTNLEATFPSDTSISITFNEPTHSTTNVISYTATVSPSASVTTSATSTSPISITTLTPGTSYSITLKATQNSITSVASSSITRLTVPSSPTSLTAGSITTTSMSVAYTNTMTGATKYYLTIAPSVNSVSVFESTTSPISLTGMLPATAYSLSMVSYNASGNSATPTYATATTLPDTPTGASIVATTLTSITVSFTGYITVAPDSYKLTSSPAIGGTTIFTSTSVSTTAGSISLSGLTGGVAYTFSIVAIKGTTSSASLSASYTTQVSAPTNVAVSSITTSSMVITCDAISNATLYTATATPTSTSDGTTSVVATLVTTALITAPTTTNPLLLTGLLSEIQYNIVVSATVLSVISVTTTVIATTLAKSMIVWMDANDVSNTTVATTTATTLTSWSNKASNNLSATTSTAITYSTSGLNSYPSLSFTATQYLTGVASNNTSGLTIFVIASINASSSSSARILSLFLNFSTSDKTSVAYMSMTRDSTTSTFKGYRNDTIASTSPTMDALPYLFETRYDGTTNTNVVFNGEENTTSVASTGTFNSTNYNIGADYAGFNRFYGNIAEVVVYNAALSDTQRQNVEGYLSWKWGLQSKLPSTHPYSSSTITAISVASDYVFRIYAGSSSSVPTETTPATTGGTTYAFTNSNLTTLSTITSRPNVFGFSSSISLKISYNLPAIFTRTFWLYAPANTTGTLISSSVNTNSVSLSSGILNSTYLTQSAVSTISQTAAWKFYAVVQTASSISVYVNGNASNAKALTTTAWSADTANNDITFGGGTTSTIYMDDIRVYNRALSSSEILVLYTSSSLSAPTPLSMATGTSTTTGMSINYVRSAGATSYTVTAVPTSGTTVVISDITANPAVLTGLTAGTMYTITMRAVNGSTTSLASSSLTVYTVTDAPTISVATTSSSSITATGAATGAASYKIYLYTSAGASISNTAGVTASGLSSSTTYQIALSALNTGGIESALSAQIFATTLVAPRTVTSNVYSSYAFSSSNTSLITLSSNIAGSGISANGGTSWRVVAFDNTVPTTSGLIAGTYRVIASSIGLDTSANSTYGNNICHAWRLFDNNSATYYHSGAKNYNLTIPVSSNAIGSSFFSTTATQITNGFSYDPYASGTNPNTYNTTNGIALNGEWVYIRYPFGTTLTPTSISFTQRTSQTPRLPYGVIVEGANETNAIEFENGRASTFTRVGTSVNGIYASGNTTNTSWTATISTTSSYNCFRIYMTSINTTSATVVNFTSITITGTTTAL